MLARALFFVFVFIPLLIIAIPGQFVITRLGLNWNFLPRLFHRCGCIFLGIKVNMIGEPEKGRPTLLLSNHISWNDIICIGSRANVTFVAKSEIRHWFFVGFMASLQRTLYVDRKKRGDAHRASREMGARLASGGAVLLFAEGQSDVGTHVLPFRSALVGAAQHAMIEAGAKDVVIQPVTIAYTRLQGLPVSRTERGMISWSKSKSFKQNVRDMLGGPTKDVTIVFGKPIPLPEGAHRKVVTKEAEVEVRRVLVALNRGLPLDPPVVAPVVPNVPALV
jgi:1-acyl-sn-glycerol-3-phosphate acyltransferase